MNCAMEYIDREESPTKKRKKLIDQASQKDTIQTMQKCVGRYLRSKLDTIRVVDKGILHGINRTRTGMRTQLKNRHKTDGHTNTIKCSKRNVGMRMRTSTRSHFYLLI